MKYYLFSEGASWQNARAHRKKLMDVIASDETAKGLQITYFNKLNVLLYNIKKVNEHNFKNCKEILKK